MSFLAAMLLKLVLANPYIVARAPYAKMHCNPCLAAAFTEIASNHLLHFACNNRENPYITHRTTFLLQDKRILRFMLKPPAGGLWLQTEQHMSVR